MLGCWAASQNPALLDGTNGIVNLSSKIIAMTIIKSAN